MRGLFIGPGDRLKETKQDKLLQLEAVQKGTRCPHPMRTRTVGEG
jgi:hypothetical protein